MSHATEPHPRTVICGAGVIGSAIAYFLSLRGVATTIVERCAPACAASGKAGGFLALDWCDGSDLGPLARKSFSLHAELAESLGRDYGYRRVETFAVAASAADSMQAHARHQTPEWLDPECVVHARLGSHSTTAQVHPEAFTHALLDAARERGVRLLEGCVDGIQLSAGGGAVEGVRIDGLLMPCDRIVFAMGPWSNMAGEWLPLPPVAGLKGHSITLRPEEPVPAHALFIEYVGDNGQRLSPEVFARPDGEVYLCGVSDDSPTPSAPDLVNPSPGANEELERVAACLSPALANCERSGVRACFRPVYADAMPLMGPVPGVDGAYLATGHNCWGILNAPASGAAMAELIATGRCELVDLSPYALERATAAALAY